MNDLVVSYEEIGEGLIRERQKTHGDFAKNASTAQGLKCTIHACSSWFDLDPVHKEALDLICTKIGRIMAGQADFKDHWRDISGYSQLAMEVCREDK